MANVFDQFDNQPQQAQSGNVFDQFDAPKQAGPTKIGMDAFPDFLKQELANADWGTRNLAGFGTALSDLYEGAKQFIGQGDPQQIQANKIIAQSAPIGALAGNVALTAIPFGFAGNSINAAAKVGTVLGALNPVEGDQSAHNIVRGKILGAATGGVTAAAGQGLANAAGDWLGNKIAGLAAQKAQNAPIQETLGNAIDAGLVVPPSSVDATMFNRFRESVGGKIATAQEASNRNASTIEGLVRQEMGMGPNDPLTSEAMQQIRKRAFDAGYVPISRAGPMPVSQDYTDALNGISQKYIDASESFPGVAAPDVQALVNSYKPLSTRWDPAALAAEAKETLGGLIANRDASRINALQQEGQVQTEAAQALGRANDFVPVPGMPRVPARISPNLDRAQEYAAALPDFTSLVAQRGAERDALGGLMGALDNTGQLPAASFDPAHALIATQTLRDQAREAFQQGNNQIGRTKKAIANEIENEVERQLSGMGKDGATLLDQFRNSRTLMAKAHDVEDAIVEGGGTLDPRVFGRKFQNQEPLTGALQVIGAFANNFPKAVQPLKQVSGPGISKLDLAMATMGGGAGATLGPLGAAAGAAVPYVAPKLARALALSSGSQNALRDIYKLGLAPRVTSGLLQYAPVGGAVLGRNALSQYLAP